MQVTKKHVANGDIVAKVVFSALAETLIQNYPELSPENLRSVFPLWDYFHSHTVEEFESENWLDTRSRAEE